MTFDIGNAIQEDSKAIWEGKKYIELRSGFNKNSYGMKMHPICKQCIGIATKP